MSKIKVALDYGGVIHPEINPTNPDHFKTRNIQRLRNKVGDDWSLKFKDLEEWEKHLQSLGEDWYQKRKQEGHDFLLKVLDLVGPENLFIISKANPKRQQETLDALEEDGLLALTETDVKLLKKENVIFIPVTQDKHESEFKEKGQAAKKHRIDILVDDDIRNLKSFKQHCRYGHCLHYVPFFEVYEYPHKTSEKCYRVSSWNQIFAYLEDMIAVKKIHQQKRANSHPGRSFDFYDNNDRREDDPLPKKRWTNRDGSEGGLGDDLPDRHHHFNSDGRGRGNSRGNSHGGRGGSRGGSRGGYGRSRGGRGNSRDGFRGDRGNSRDGFRGDHGNSRDGFRGDRNHSRDYHREDRQESKPSKPQPADFSLNSLSDFPSL